MFTDSLAAHKYPNLPLPTNLRTNLHEVVYIEDDDACQCQCEVKTHIIESE